MGTAALCDAHNAVADEVGVGFLAGDAEGGGPKNLVPGEGEGQGREGPAAPRELAPPEAKPTAKPAGVSHSDLSVNGSPLSLHAARREQHINNSRSQAGSARSGGLNAAPGSLLPSHPAAPPHDVNSRLCFGCSSWRQVACGSGRHHTAPSVVRLAALGGLTPIRPPTLYSYRSANPSADQSAPQPTMNASSSG